MLAGKKRMAVGTYAQSLVLTCGTGLEDKTTSRAGKRHIMIFRVDTFFHFKFSLARSVIHAGEKFHIVLGGFHLVHQKTHRIMRSHGQKNATKHP